MIRLLLGIFILGCAIVMGVSLYVFMLYIHPKRYITPVTPENLGLRFEDVSFRTKDGIILSGWFIPNENSDAVIIICHGYPADKGDILKPTAFLSSGYNLFFFDFRGLGRSGGNLSTIGVREKTDFLSAVCYIKKRGFHKIGAFGFSMGGAVIIMSNSPDIKAAVVDSAFADMEDILHLVYGGLGPFRFPFVSMTNLYSKIFLKTDIKTISPKDSIKHLNFPLFIIHAECDDVIPVKSAYALYGADRRNKIWIIPHTSHAERYDINEKEYEERVMNFFNTHL